MIPKISPQILKPNRKKNKYAIITTIIHIPISNLEPLLSAIFPTIGQQEHH